jgi:S1-C subfamily serine protease
MSVEPGGPAARAGIEAGDIVIALGAAKVTGVDDLHRILTEDSIGRTLPLTILRGSRPQEIPITPDAAG